MSLLEEQQKLNDEIKNVEKIESNQKNDNEETEQDKKIDDEDQ